MHIDVLFDRGEYAQVVELFRPREDLGKHACRVLADAETAVARSLSGQDVLCDLLRYEAIGHYFQAGFRGVWTLECARTLLDQVENVEEMVDLFRQHPVEIARPGTRVQFGNVMMEVISV